MLGNSEPSQEELLEMQRQQEQERELRQTATGMAQSMATQADPGDEMAAPGYWENIRDADIESGIDEYDEHIADFLSVEFSGQFSTGNITYEDWQKMQWRIEQEFWVAKNEMKSPESGLDDIDMAAMGYGARPELDDSRARRLRHAQSVKKMMTSLSVDARGLKSGTEIHTVSKTESEEPEGDDGGWLRRKLV